MNSAARTFVVRPAWCAGASSNNPSGAQCVEGHVPSGVKGNGVRHSHLFASAQSNFNLETSVDTPRIL